MSLSAWQALLVPSNSIQHNAAAASDCNPQRTHTNEQMSSKVLCKTFLSLVTAPVLGSRINATARDRLLTYLRGQDEWLSCRSCCLCLPEGLPQWHSDLKVHTKNVTNTISEKHSSGSVQESHLLPFSLAGAKVLLFFGTTKYFVIFWVFFLFRCDFRKFIARIRSQCDAKPLSC